MVRTHMYSKLNSVLHWSLIVMNNVQKKEFDSSSLFVFFTLFGCEHYHEFCIVSVIATSFVLFILFRSVLGC